MRCPCPKRREGRLAGTQMTCVCANTTGPVGGAACDARARKDRKAGQQGRKQIAAPQTPQGLYSGKHALCGRHGLTAPIISLNTFSRYEQGHNLCWDTCVCDAEMRLGCKHALNLLIGVWAANWERIGVLAANWRSGCKLAIGSELAFGLLTGSELAFWLQIGVWAANRNRQRAGVLAANLQRIGVLAANLQRTGVLAANWRLGCKPAIGSELAFGLQMS